MISQKIVLLILTILFACGKNSQQIDANRVQLTTKKQGQRSTTAGNLAATALQFVHELDFVLYPTGFINNQHAAIFDKNNPDNTDEVLGFFPEGNQDVFLISLVRGDRLKEFLFQRTMEKYAVELEVAGLRYHYQFKGGYPLVQNVTMANGAPIDDRRFYRAAFSKHFFFSGDTFPSYRFRNGGSRVFQETELEVSTRDAIVKYIKGNYPVPDLSAPRAMVDHTPGLKVGLKNISEIQGTTHISPHLADEVSTIGMITAIGDIEWYPGGTEIYIQSLTPDNDPRTSEGIQLYIDGDLKSLAVRNSLQSLAVGDIIQVQGQVYEEMSFQGLSNTQIRNITSVIKLGDQQSSGRSIEPIVIGENTKRPIPLKQLSTFRGDLNFKKELILTDGIDFWESLEGMVVQVNNPRVMGFRGGQESVDPFDLKTYLTLYLLPDGDAPIHQKRMTQAMGMLPDTDRLEFNPSIFTISTGNLTKGLDPNSIFQVGDLLEGSMTGILAFKKNLFGDGEFNLLLPNETEALTHYSKNQARTEYLPLSLRDNFKTRFDRNQIRPDLTIAAYNIKNIAGTGEDQFRIDMTGQMIRDNLQCPNIVGLIEVQDDNGLDFTGSSSAENTLQQMIDAIKKDNGKKIGCSERDYRSINIDPLNHREGGVPGANIRVAIIYDANTLKFTARGSNNPLEETVITREGNLSINPGRVFPNDSAFKNTRKSLVAQFDYFGKPIFVIVNHLNSKLGDGAHWSNIQPPNPGSEQRRVPMAQKLNSFVQLLEKRNPEAHVALIGDFNAFMTENAMKVLEGNNLKNLMTYQNLVAPNRRYTTNHNGNSQSLDYIVVNKKFLEANPVFDVLHINSDHMGRLSDHDPVIGGFYLR